MEYRYINVRASEQCKLVLFSECVSVPKVRSRAYSCGMIVENTRGMDGDDCRLNDERKQEIGRIGVMQKSVHGCKR